MTATEQQRRANLRLAMVLACLAALFGFAFVAKIVWFGA
jgi:hypothetical protein